MTLEQVLWGVFISIIAALILKGVPIIWEKLTGTTKKTPRNIGRENEIQRIIGHILTRHSSVIVGSPHSGKTSILTYLRSEKAQSDYGSDAKLTFSYLDTLELDKECNQAEFWKIVLKPLQKITNENNHVCNKWWFFDIFSNCNQWSKLYTTCKENGFNNFALEKLFEQIAKDNRLFVLMIDECEGLLQRPSLKKAEFFGGTLRKFAQNYNVPLILIITMNWSLKQFHQGTKEFHGGIGSDYFSFMEQDQIFLGALSDEDIERFLAQYSHRFSSENKQFIKKYAGGHPELLRVAAEVVIEAPKRHSVEQLQQAFLDRVLNLLKNTLRFLSPKVCQAFIAVINHSDNLSGFKSELRELKKRGLLMQDEKEVWQVHPQILVEFCKDKTVRELCDRKIA